MIISKEAVRQVDLEPLRPFAVNHAEFFAHDWHYRLLAYLAMQFPGKTMVDIGTNMGDSALALSAGGGDVHSFDVVDKRAGQPHRPNVHCRIEDLWDPSTREKHRRLLLESTLIFIDIAPHDGWQELELVRWLEENRYRGIIVADDIWYYKPMRDLFWSQIEERHKADLTEVGHWSGTGIITFDGRVHVEHTPVTSAWTLVTGYFDLASREDASPEMQSRPKTHYFDTHGAATLSVDENLIVFCEPGVEEQVWKMRPTRLHGRTKVITKRFEDFPLYRYHPRIVANRGGPWCPTDPRMTASYYLLCMARYDMVREAMTTNPFGSTHFGWINLCLERVGWKNFIHLDRALDLNRDKFSTCFIDYVPKPVVSNWHEFFGGNACWGRCTMSSGFFTGREDYLRLFCDRIEQQFLTCLAAGYGHADEQLYPMIYFGEPNLFDWYPGDYAEVVTNYAHVHDRAEQPIMNLITNSFMAGEFGVCRRAAMRVWDSYRMGRCQLAGPALDRLLDIIRRTC